MSRWFILVDCQRKQNLKWKHFPEDFRFRCHPLDWDFEFFESVNFWWYLSTDTMGAILAKFRVSVISVFAMIILTICWATHLISWGGKFNPSILRTSKYFAWNTKSIFQVLLTFPIASDTSSCWSCNPPPHPPGICIFLSSLADKVSFNWKITSALNMINDVMIFLIAGIWINLWSSFV